MRVSDWRAFDTGGKYTLRRAAGQLVCRCVRFSPRDRAKRLANWHVSAVEVLRTDPEANTRQLTDTRAVGDRYAVARDLQAIRIKRILRTIRFAVGDCVPAKLHPIGVPSGAHAGRQGAGPVQGSTLSGGHCGTSAAVRLSDKDERPCKSRDHKQTKSIP